MTFKPPNSNEFHTAAHIAPGSRELRTLKDENEHLKRALLRKDKALAEAAALLILLVAALDLMLQKKFRALWEDEVT